MATPEPIGSRARFLDVLNDVTPSTSELIGSSPKLAAVLEDVKAVAATDCAVLIQGETGTGKELIARVIHETSARRHNRCVSINCAALPAALVESELFGHERGAFTGAISPRMGHFQAADRGTLYLDEIGELPIELQPKLLRAIQEQAFERLGSTHTIRVDVRIIAATNQYLGHLVEARRFRMDLYYRLNVFPITLPPLRERTGDIPLLVHHFVRTWASRHRKSITHVPDEVMAALIAYHWPGNIRELQNFIERSVVLTKGAELQAPVAELVNTLGTIPGVRTLADAERAPIISCHATTAAAGTGVRFNPRETLIVGETVSHYRIIAEIGAGGMGVVYKAEDLRLGRLVALKFLAPELMRDPDAKRRFFQEARTASAIDHVNVCTIHDIDETTDGRVFLSMAYCDGETLKKRLERGPLAATEAVRIAVQVARGLARAHQARIVHRDVKPGNIMVTTESEVKLLDFGIATITSGDDLTRTGAALGTILGTIAYLAPEHVRGGDGDERSDVWALGVVLYEMLAGSRPFSGANIYELLQAIVDRPQAPLTEVAGVTDDIARVVDRALDKARERRYANAGELMHALEACVQTSGSEGSPASCSGAGPGRSAPWWQP
jgi:Sigma-54 interaction domain/Protein kinase domain